MERDCDPSSLILQFLLNRHYLCKQPRVGHVISRVQVGRKTVMKYLQPCHATSSLVVGLYYSSGQK